MNRAEVIVLGTGGVGSAALYHLARRGVKVVGLDRFPPGHDRGSSHGDTRIIRMAYYEHPDYVPLLRRSYELWEELERVTGRDLYRETGLLEIGPPEGEILPGVRRSATQHELPLEELSAQNVADRFPGFVLPEGMEAVFERKAGFLRVEACVLAHLDAAQTAGAELRSGVSVRSWSAADDSIVVETDDGSWAAERIVIAAGAWSDDLLHDLGLPLRILRKPLFWFPADPIYEVDAGCPQFFYELGDGAFYGFPALPGRGLKLAEHTGGEPVQNPLELDRSLRKDDQDRVETFLRQCMPGVERGRAIDHAVCMYTSTPDGHFIVDRHPRHPRTAFAAGLSGHGFKMTSVLGEILADLATDTEPSSASTFLRLDRESLEYDRRQG